MNNKKPNDPLYPNGFDETPKSTGELPKPTKKDDDLNPLEKLNRKIGVYLSPSTTNATNEEKKRKIGVIITTIIILTLLISTYYFLVYEPAQEELSLARTTKLNELHDLYSGALTTSSNAMILENKINNAGSAEEVDTTGLWQFMKMKVKIQSFHFLKLKKSSTEMMQVYYPR